MQEIEKMYEMIYPYGTYGQDPVSACYAINRELRTLCTENQRLYIILLYKSLSIPNKKRITPETPTSDICGMIQEHIFNTCMSLDDIDRAKLILAFKGALTVIDPEIKICKEIQEIVSAGPNVGNMPIDIFYGKDILRLGPVDDGPVEWDGIRKGRILHDDGLMDDNMWQLVKSKALEEFRRGYNSRPDLLNLDSIMKIRFFSYGDGFMDLSQARDTVVRKFEKRHAEYILKLFRKMYEGNISPWIKWNEIC